MRVETDERALVMAAVLSTAACTGKPVGVGEKVWDGVCDGVTVCDGVWDCVAVGEHIFLMAFRVMPLYGRTGVHVKPPFVEAHEPYTVATPGSGRPLAAPLAVQYHLTPPDAARTSAKYVPEDVSNCTRRKIVRL